MTKKEKKMKLLKIIAILSLLLLTSVNIFAQSLFDKTPTPADEEFQVKDGVVTNSYKYHPDKFTERDIYQLYNADKTLWYEFSFSEKSPIYYWRNKRDEFKPFVPADLYSTLFLRMKAESKNWYEVFINEDNDETKYIWKGYPLLEYLSLEYFIKFPGWVVIDSKKNPLRETPGGKIINTGYESENERQSVLLIEGDWLLVRPHPPAQAITGWIRWRDGRKIFIGWFLNNNKVPEQ